MVVEHIPFGPFVNESERKALETLKSRLTGFQGKGKWLLLTNVMFSARQERLSDEIDMIAIGPTGLHIIEIKHWDQYHIKERPLWVEEQADILNTKVKIIKSKISRDIDVGFLEGKILFTKGSYRAPENKPRPVYRGVKVYGLSEWRDLLELEGRDKFNDRTVETICREIEPQTRLAVTGDTRNFGEYINLERVSPIKDRFHRIFKGIHQTRRDRVILHIYDLSASDEKNAFELAKREFDTIQRLQKSKWLPRLLDSFQSLPQYPGEIYYFSTIDPIAPPIVDRKCDPNWTIDDRIRFAAGAAAALSELHHPEDDQEIIVHRKLSPQSIYAYTNNDPLFGDFMFTKLQDAITLGDQQIEGVNEEYLSPEVHRGGLAAADTRSDVFALCSSLRVLFADLDDDKALCALQILKEGIAADPARRCHLNELQQSLQRLVGDIPPTKKPVPSACYWDEDIEIEFRENIYKIVARLGSGGVGTTFKVVQLTKNRDEELGTFVAKAIHEEKDGGRALEAYAMARPYTFHPHLASIVEYAAKWEVNQFVALMKWLEGTPISDYKGLLPLYAEDLSEKSVVDLILQWLLDMCDGLSALHQVNLVHGDVSPKNIIVHEGTVTLTDYDMVTRAGKPPRGGGTPLYSSPDLLARNTILPGDDIFALATTFFHVLFDHEPFVNQVKNAGLNWQSQERELYPRVTKFLDKATAPEPGGRFASAMEARSFIQGIFGIEPELPTQEAKILTPQKVPWLLELLNSYPGSLHGNIETRGLDSDFAAATYVETSLDQTILEEIKNRHLGLIILCGNAGDGKTAFLQHLARGLGSHHCYSAQRMWAIPLTDGYRVIANLDGSAAFEGRTSTELLDEMFAPYHDGSWPPDMVNLVAINSGPLLAWIEDYEYRYTSTPLTKMLWHALGGNLSNLPPHIRFLDLNNRSLVGGINLKGGGGELTTDFLDRLLDKMLGGFATDVWQSCPTCSEQNRCPAWDSVKLLRHPELRPRVMGRLYEALQAVHQRGEVHITTRELRANLSYIFFGVYWCEDFHQGPEIQPWSYYDRAFQATSPHRQGELLKELTYLDPGLEAHPLIDRHLLGRGAAEKEGLAPSYPDLPSLASARRRAYFEWTEEQKIIIGATPYALGLARGRHLGQFRRVPFMNFADQAQLVTELCRGIARLEDLPLSAFKDEKVVPLKVSPRTPTESAVWVIKPRERFSLEAKLPDSGGLLETLHTHLILKYLYSDGSKEEMFLGTELFHILLELKDGYQMADVFSDDIFAQLAIFTQRLTQEDDRDLFAWNPMEEETVFRIMAQRSDVRQQIVISRAKGEADP